MNAKARLILTGDAEVLPEVRKLVDDLQQENWRLRVQVAHLQGDRITKDRKGRATFQTPTRRQARAANRRSRRTRCSCWTRTCTPSGRSSRPATPNGGRWRASRT